MAAEDHKIRLQATLLGTSSDRDGEWTIKLAIPATDAGKAAQLSLMKQIVFDVVFTPESVSKNKI